MRYVSILIGIAALVIAGDASGSPVDGETEIQGLLRLHEQDSYKLDLESGEDTVIRVTGDGKGDLDCYLYDDHHYVVAKDADTTDMCVINYAPAKRGKYVLTVINMGPEADLFHGTIR